MSDQPNKKIEYKDNIVCFIDILGFKEIIKHTVNLDNSLDESSIAFELMLMEKLCHNDMHIPPIPEVEHIQFSDSIVIFAPVNIENLSNIISIADSVILGCLMHKRLCRGGITAGKLYHNGSVFFGPAIVSAVELEKKAINPRIVFDEESFSNFSISIRTLNVDRQHFDCPPISIDEDDDKLFIDYISNGIFNDRCDRNIISHIENLYKMTIDGLEHKDEKVRKKYEWLRSKYNKYVQQIKKIPGVSQWTQKRFSDIPLIVVP